MATPVFLSYQRGDFELARLFAERMAAYGGELWWDNAIAPGDDWRESIIDALMRAPIVVLLHSAAAEKSPEVQKELAVASAQRKTIVAVRLEDRMPSGRFLYEMAALNWVEAFVEPAEQLDALARQMAALAPGARGETVSRAVDARPLAAGRWHRLSRSTPAVMMLWLVALLTGLAAQNAMGEGMAAAGTELGLGLGDIATAVGALIVGAPLVVLRFVLGPPGQAAGWAFWAAALIMTLCYALMARNGWNALMRWRARSSGGG